MSLGNQVEQFNTVYGVPIHIKPTLPTFDDKTRIFNLISEEFKEMDEALDEDDIVHLAKELGDILYITAQQMNAQGLPVDAILREIHASNMSKLDDEGMPIYREDGKVLKGPNFFKAEAGIARVILEASENV